MDLKLGPILHRSIRQRLMQPNFLFLPRLPSFRLKCHIFLIFARYFCPKLGNRGKIGLCYSIEHYYRKIWCEFQIHIMFYYEVIQICYFFRDMEQIKYFSRSNPIILYQKLQNWISRDREKIFQFCKKHLKKHFLSYICKPSQ